MSKIGGISLKVAKRPISREKMVFPAQKPAQKKDPRGGVANFKGKNIENQFTPGERTREISFKANEIKKVRAAARARLLDLAIKDGQLERLFVQGLQGDTEAMAIAEKASKLVGLDYQASPEASQKIEVSGKMDNSLNVKIESVK